MNPTERQLLIDSLSDQLTSLLEHKFYYPSRVRYLDAILSHIGRLDRNRRYAILALNSSVASQRMLGSDGYDFKNYLRAFRERSILGDYVLRIYCLSRNSNCSLGEQLLDLKAVISDNSLEKCLNLYRINGEGFNCAYFIPLKNSADVKQLDDMFRNSVGGAVSSIHGLLEILRDSLDLNESTMFFEHHDYDSLNTRGCGFRFEPDTDSAEARDKFLAYTHIAERSSQLADPRITLDPQFARYRVAIIAALPIEFDAIRAQLDVGSMALLDDSAGITFFHATTTTEGICVNIIVAQLPTTGNVSSSLATALLIERYQVEDIFLVGIAGGLRGEVRLGDVVIGNTIVYAERKKVTLDNERPDYRIYESRFSELSTIHSRNRYRARMLTDAPAEPHEETCAHFGVALLCVEKVVTDPEWLTLVRRRVQRKLVAVENEATGVYFAASQINPSRTRYIAIKGISDYADAEKDDRWHEYAADAAAAYTIDAIHLMRKA